MSGASTVSIFKVLAGWRRATRALGEQRDQRAPSTAAGAAQIVDDGDALKQAAAIEAHH